MSKLITRFKEWIIGRKFKKAFDISYDKDEVIYFQGEREI